MSAAMPLLRVRGLCKAFGALQVARNLELDIAEGERLALIGPNGAGKTTFVNLLTGVLAPTSGTIELEGCDVGKLAQHQRVRAGIGRTFQITSLFREMTVFENIFLAIAERRRLYRDIWRRAWKRSEACEETAGILESLELSPVAGDTLSHLPYGRQRLVELAIALALRPKLLLLDEPAAGISQQETSLVLKGVEQLPHKMAVLMIDHDMDLVFRFAKRIVVLVDGGIFRIGTPDTIAADPDVRRLYLGE